MKTYKKITGFIFSGLIATNNCIACDLSAFTQSDFSERCQRLIDYCQKAHITFLANYPDLEQRFNSLSKDWIDFYLSHGRTNNKPPNMNFIKDEVWNDIMQELGKTIQRFIHKKLPSGNTNALYLKFIFYKTMNFFQSSIIALKLQNFVKQT